MEENIYSKLPKLKVELSLSTLVIGALVIVFAFIIPISLIENYYNSNSTGQVAGVSTQTQTSSIFLPILNQAILLEGQSGVLAIIGITIILICIIILLVLLIEFLKKKNT